MKSIVLLISMSLFGIAFSQSKFKFGVNSSIGNSTFYNSSDEPIFSMKLSTSIGGKLRYSLNEKWSVNFNITNQKRGAIFDKGIYSYNPRYNLNYIDLALGTELQTKEAFKNTKVFFGFSGSYNKLIKSLRTNNYESYNIMNEMKMSDIGAQFSVGLNISRVNKDLIQFSFFTNTGFVNVFSGSILENGVMGKNLLFGLNIGYLFGL